jgi:DNA repair photolyase
MKPFVREKLCKTLLCKSGICDYTINCYTGCLHNCSYCYARFMRRFTGHAEPWGGFLDIRVNAVEVLRKELASRRRGAALRLSDGDTPKGAPSVFVSSVCDGWQPAEAEYQLTRECVRLLVEAGFEVNILTKNVLATRDFDVLKGQENVEFGMSITCTDDCVAALFEPGASPNTKRLDCVKRAADLGITTCAMAAPLVPGVYDTEERLHVLFSAFVKAGVQRLNVDKLNLYPSVAASVSPIIRKHFPQLTELYRRLLSKGSFAGEYWAEVRRRVEAVAQETGLARVARVFI